MHIAFVSEDYPPRTFNSGEGTYVRAFAQTLVRLGHQVSVLTPSPEGGSFIEQDEGVQVHWIVPSGTMVLGRNRILLPRMVTAVHAQLLRIRRRTPIDVVEFAYPNAWGALTAAMRSIPIVARGHGTIRHSCELEGVAMTNRHLRLLDILDGYTLRRSDLVIAITAFTRDLYKQTYGIPDRNLVTQPLPLSAPDSFLKCAVSPDGSVTRARDTVVFLYAGRHHWRKRPHSVVQAFARADLSGARLLMVGDDSDTSPVGGSMHEYCRTLALAGGVADRVQIVGHVSQEELLSYYRSADVLVGPSLYETFGLVYIEAMAMGLPVIASTTGASPEIVTPASGLIVPPDDIDALAAAMTRLAFQPELRKSMGEMGRQLVLEKYTPEQHAREMLSWYELAIDHHSCRALPSRLKSPPRIV